MNPSESLNRISVEQISHLMSSGRFRLAQIKTVQQTAIEEDVFDVSLREHGDIPYSIVTNGIVTHNSIVPEYLEAMMGAQLPDASKILSGGRVRYYNTNVLEEATAQIAAFIKTIPTKVWCEEAGTWAYQLPKGLKSTTAMLKTLEAIDLKPDKKLSTDGDWMLPTLYSGPEAAIFIDSWPALIPRHIEENDGGVGLAAQARALAAELPKFAGKLKQKSVILWSVNQLRDIPMVRYGETVREPGGNALKFATTVRNRMFSRAVPPGFDRDPKTGSLCVEDSVMGKGIDTYAFKAYQNTKSKVGRPFLKTMFRMWVSDASGEARGFDPVFDVLNYLTSTGQATGPKKKLVIKLHREGSPKVPEALAKLEGQAMTYETFKKLVLAEHFKDRDLMADVAKTLHLSKSPKLREWLFQQVRVHKTLFSLAENAADENLEE